MPYWLTSTLAATPAFAWVYLGLGIPWALALLPRADWRDRPLVLATAFAAGPALLTAWMFALGTVGDAARPLLRLDLVLAGTAVLALVGVALAWRKRAPAGEPRRPPLAWDEKLVLALIGVALVIRWLGIAYWPFTAYDALWVYGYEGRLYLLTGAIPSSIGYYPQFLPLQFTFGQLAPGGVDDHGARAVLIFLHTGAILATYVLGARLLGRRAGIIAAALWALYPHVGEWSRFGDLEIPVTFAFTLAAAFFLMAWTGHGRRRRYALLAGLALGVALWTKPTAGAFIWGVLALLAIDFARVRGDVRAWRPRLETAVLTGLAAAPLGGLWYVRNLALGHAPIVLPPPFWQTLAAQSGAELGWPLLALGLLLATLWLGPRATRPDARLTLAGALLVVAGVTPSIVAPHRLTPVEWALLGAGAALLARALRPLLPCIAPQTRARAGRVGWALLLAAPYVVTWFFSYSYHYRLSFAVVPLMILPSALILSGWRLPLRAGSAARVAWAVAIVAVSLAGLVAPLYDVNAGWDWLWTDALPDDTARYRSGNPALMDVVAGLQAYVDEGRGLLVVAAPGIKRLPFFFPLADIRTEAAPTRLADVRDVVYFVDSHPEGSGAYEGVPLHDNQLLSALSRPGILRFAWGRDDGIFRYHVYEMNLANRFAKPDPNAQPDAEIDFGGFARLVGYDLSTETFWPGRRVHFRVHLRVLATPDRDYTLFVHLRSADGEAVAVWDNPIARSEDGSRYYSSLVWQPKEYLAEERILRTRDAAIPPGDYALVIGFYDAVTGERVPVTVDGKPAGDAYTLPQPFHFLAAEP